MTPTLINISTISNIKQLSNFLRCEEFFLQNYLSGNICIVDHNNYLTPNQTDYTSVIDKFYIPKKKSSESYREVYSVRTDALKNVLKVLSTYFNNSYIPLSSVHGYVSEKNIKTNAQEHLAKKYLLSVDIADFFGNITIEMINEAFLHFGFSGFASQHLSQIVTLNNSLPPGYPTSPVISNMIANHIDQELLLLADSNCVYTRYADDLYFSSNYSLPSLEAITAIIVRYGFNLNPAKTKYMFRGTKQYVTGLTVFDNKTPRVTKKIKRNLRLEIYYMRKFGLLAHVLRKLNKSAYEYEADSTLAKAVDIEVKKVNNRIIGWLRFLHSVEEITSQKLMIEYEKVNLLH